MRAQESVMENEYKRATPTVKNFIYAMSRNDRVIITNICGSYGGALAKDHMACAAVDIPMRYLPDAEAASNYFMDEYNMSCVPHYNYSGSVAEFTEKENAHLHCTDRFFLEQGGIG